MCLSGWLPDQLVGPVLLSQPVAAVGMNVWSWWKPRWEVGWGLSALEHFKLGGKKLGRSAELPSWGQVDCPSSSCRCMKCTDGWGQNWPLRFVSLVKTEKIKDCPLVGIMLLHAQLILTSGFVGHARGKSQEFIFPPSLRRLITFLSHPFLYVWLSLFMYSKKNWQGYWDTILGVMISLVQVSSGSLRSSASVNHFMQKATQGFPLGKCP